MRLHSNNSRGNSSPRRSRHQRQLNSNNLWPLYSRLRSHRE